MFYENELRFLCDTFKKCHVQIATVSPDDPLDGIIDTELDSLFGRISGQTTIHGYLGDLAPRTMYKLVGPFKLSYTYLLLPETEADTVLFVGPYLSSALTSRQILEIGEERGLSPKSQRFLNEYYTGIPVLLPSSHLFDMLSTFCERIWESPSFAIVDVNRESHLPVSPIHDSIHTDGFDDVLMNMKAMEKRYDFENELIHAVTLGQIHKESQLFSAFSDQLFEKRTADPLRNAQNYCIIMNTLLRKAAEAGGVHPVYLDRVSSSFAVKIGRLPSLSENFALMCEMFRSYCRLVRRHSMKHYSPVVRQTVLLIDSDLSADLTLKSLAANQNVSSGYLSTIFKQETGKPISQYISEKRIKHAAHLLSTTNLQVQTIALHCGIMDVQYFSKVFKKQIGKTPKEYRESLKQKI